MSGCRGGYVRLAPATVDASRDRCPPADAAITALAGWVAAGPAGTDFQAADLEPFDPKKRGIGQLRMSLIRVQLESGYVLLYRKLNSNQIVARAGKIPLIQRQDRLDVIEGDTMLIERGVDAVVIGGVAFFRDRPRFQRLFGFLQELRKQAATTFDDVTSDLQISNLDAMRAGGDR